MYCHTNNSCNCTTPFGVSVEGCGAMPAKVDVSSAIIVCVSLPVVRVPESSRTFALSFFPNRNPTFYDPCSFVTYL
ncbi:hypothetical protein RJT34_24031 [Clitoria ternatea]|uniref:Uncharacterized protein n=1 Tax=Clitoria ternatea TaxID=43366 RepID=A0AAN9FMJ3_CLITE